MIKEELLNKFVTNDQIKYNQVRLVGFEGEQLGIVQRFEALNKAKILGLDLLLITEQTEPPVCRIVDFNKWKFAQVKKDKEQKRKSRESQIIIKELWFRPNTEKHDLDVKLRQTQKFLNHGNRIKLGIRLRGREQTFKKEAKDKLQNFVDNFENLEIIKPVTIQDKQIIVIIGPQK